MSKFKTAATVAVLVTAAGASASVIPGGDLVVLRQGDGTATLANTGNAVSVLDVNNAGAVQQTVAVPTTGTGQILQSGTATSEGAISLGGNVLTVSGYSPATGTGTTASLTGSTAAAAPRVYGTVALATGTFAIGSNYGTNYSANNVRSTATDGAGKFYGAGGNTGTVYNDGATNTVIQSAAANTRVDNVIGGNLYYSSASGTVGIFSLGVTPTAATTATPVLSGVAGEGTSPYDFAFSPDGLTLYVADDGIGVQKFTRAAVGSAFTLAYNIISAATANRAYGVGVDFGGTSPVVYYTTPTDLLKYVDTGVAGTATSIASAGTNFAFRGLEFVPSGPAAGTPEPAALALLGLAGMAGLRRRRV